MIEGGTPPALGRRTLGVAVPVVEPYAAELEAWRERFGDPLAHAVPAHVTLVPPTEVDETVLDQVEQHLAEVAAQAEPFDLHLRGTGTFRPVSPVVFVAVVDGISGCEALERAARTGPLGVDVRFPYHPHVTVAHHVSEPVLDEAYAALAGYDVRFTVQRFALYEHGADGIWRRRRDYPIGGNVPA
ncbi:MAG: 2'-5' RNA ligase family protein [Candidatus Nanopelagicales bacterium]